MIKLKELTTILGLTHPSAEQNKIISAPLENSIIIAGAGSGKTETIVNRLIWLIFQEKVELENILCLTFTRKATRQLLEKILEKLYKLAKLNILPELITENILNKDMNYMPRISTYDAFASNLVVNYGTLLHLPNEINQIDEAQFNCFVAEKLSQKFDLELTSYPKDLVKKIVSLYHEITQYDIDIDEFEKKHIKIQTWLDNLIDDENITKNKIKKLEKLSNSFSDRTKLLPFIKQIETELLAQGLVNYNMNYNLANKILRQHNEIVNQYHKKYKLVLLDEYQDTSFSQRKLLLTLFAKSNSYLNAVGDPLQSIYVWRGAEVENLVKFKTDFVNNSSPATQYTLLTSWRNKASILNAANAISESIRKKYKEEYNITIDQLKSNDSELNTGITEINLFKDLDSEIKYITQIIRDIDNDKSIAILVRRNREGKLLSHLLRAEGICVEFLDEKILDLTEIQDIIAMLTLTVNSSDNIAAIKLLLGPKYSIPLEDIKNLKYKAKSLINSKLDTDNDDYSTEKNLFNKIKSEIYNPTPSLVDTILNLVNFQQFSDKGKEKIFKFATDMKHLNSFQYNNLLEYIIEIEKVLNLDIEFDLKNKLELNKVKQNSILIFHQIVINYMQYNGNDINKFINYLKEAKNLNDFDKLVETDDESDLVNSEVDILTIHAAKGLEWDYVFIPNLVDGIFPAAKNNPTWISDFSKLPKKYDEKENDFFEWKKLFEMDSQSSLLDYIEKLKENYQLDEERRLMYVAMTRAKTALILSSHRFKNTEGKENKISEFLLDLKKLSETNAAVQINKWEENIDKYEYTSSNEVIEKTWPIDIHEPYREKLNQAVDLVNNKLKDFSTISNKSLTKTQAMNFITEKLKDSNLLQRKWYETAKKLLTQEDNAITSIKSDKNQIKPITLSAGRYSYEKLFDSKKNRNDLISGVINTPNLVSYQKFHFWLTQHFNYQKSLFEFDTTEMNTNSDSSSKYLTELKSNFLVSLWANITPLYLDYPFHTIIDNRNIHGRVHAIFPGSLAEIVAGESKYKNINNITIVEWFLNRYLNNYKIKQYEIKLELYKYIVSKLLEIPITCISAVVYNVLDQKTIPIILSES